MLLLTNGIVGLSKADLRPEELEYINRKANLYCNFVTVLRDGFMSTIAFRLIPEGRGKKRHNVLYAKECHRWIPKTDEHYEVNYFFRVFMSRNFNCWFTLREWNKGLRWYTNKEGLPMPNEILHPTARRYASGKWHTVEDWNLLPTRKDYAEWIRRNVYKYFDMPDNIGIESWYAWDFLAKYMKGLPASEYYVKLGYPAFVRSGSFCRYRGKNLQRFCRWLSKYGAGLRSNRDPEYIGYSQKEVRDFYKNKINTAEIPIYKAMERLNLSKNETVRVMKYLCKQYNIVSITDTELEWRIPHYKDYLETMAFLGVDISDSSVRFPKDLEKRFKLAMKQKRLVQDKELDAKIMQTIQNMNLPKSMEFDDGFSLQLATSHTDMVNVGNELSICVGSAGYAEKMADCKCVIMFLRKDGKLQNCIELQTPKEGRLYKVVQNRGRCNLNSKVQEQSEKCVEAYIIEANKAYRARMRA